MNPSTSPEQTSQETSPKVTKNSFFKETFKYAIIALVIVVPIRTWIAQPFIVNGSSMDDTFKNAEYLIVDEISYRFQDPKRGEVLIFKYPQDPSKYFIKRLIGLPGETVIVSNDSVVIKNKEYPDGMKLTEPYTGSRTFGKVTTTLAANEYFVMGDNRMVSSDSRIWGPLPKEDIIGRPILRLFPFSRTGIFPGMVASSTIINQ